MTIEGGRRVLLTDNNAPQLSQPRISIIIVTFNAAKTLQNCLNSIYKQWYAGLEIIIMDGASTDGTLSILQQNNEQISYWRSEKDAGIYDAMNKALNYIRSEWVYFIGADDALRDEFSDLAAELEDDSAIYYSNVWCRGKKCSGFINTYYQAKVGMYHQSMIYPASVFKKHRYDLNYKISADYVLNMRLNKDKSVRFVYKDHIVADFNHTGISGNNEDVELAKNKSELIRINFGTSIWLRYKFRELKGKLKALLSRRN